jgi:hypothetical protein
MSGESAAEGKVENQQQDAAPGANVKTVQDIPVIFADGIMSQAWTQNLSKFYLVRYDSDPLAQSGNSQKIVAQIVMPNDGFVMAFAFLEHRLKTMIESGAITHESLEKSRQFWLKSQV